LANILAIMNRYSLTKVPSDILKEIADRHKKLRKINKYSQAELAKRSGVSLGTIKRFESTGQIALESLLKLAYLLDSLNDFNAIFLKEDMSKIEKLFSTKTSNK
jgi:transcriptional regulator with XRE-family HTH domain